MIVDRNGQQETYTGDIVVVSCGAANTRALASDVGQRRASCADLPMVPTWSAATTCSTTPWRWWHLSRRENPTVFQKTLSINDFYLSAPDCAFPLGNIQMIGKSHGPMFRDDAPKFAPGFTLDEMARHAVDFWLTSEDLALPQNRVTLNAQNEIQLALRIHQRRGDQPPAIQTASNARTHGHASASDSKQSVSGKAYSHRRRRPPGRHLPLWNRTRERRSSTSTARRTNSTICMWSTRVSFRASAR